MSEDVNDSDKKEVMCCPSCHLAYWLYINSRTFQACISFLCLD